MFSWYFTVLLGVALLLELGFVPYKNGVEPADFRGCPVAD
jgi:hypothetical protein